MSAADILRTVLRDADMIGESPDGRAWLLLGVPRPWLDELAVFGADTEDDEPDADGEEEPLEDDDEAEPEVA